MSIFCTEPKTIVKRVDLVKEWQSTSHLGSENGCLHNGAGLHDCSVIAPKKGKVYFKHASFFTHPIPPPAPSYPLPKQWLDRRMIWSVSVSTTLFPVAWFWESLFRSRIAAAVAGIFPDLSVSGVSRCSEACHLVDRLWHKGMLHGATRQKHTRNLHAQILPDIGNGNCSESL